MRTKASKAARLQTRLNKRVVDLESQIAQTQARLVAATLRKQTAEADMAALDQEDKRLAAILEKSALSVASARALASELRSLADGYDALAEQARDAHD